MLKCLNMNKWDKKNKSNVMKKLIEENLWIKKPLKI